MAADFSSVQYRIREQANAMRSAATELSDWEADMKKREAALKAKKAAVRYHINILLRNPHRAYSKNNEFNFQCASR